MSRLRRWKKRKCSLLILTRWANLCRASGAGRNANAPFSSQRLRAGLKYAAPPALEETRMLFSSQRLRAGLKYVAPTALERGRAGTARRKGGGQDIPLVPEIFDAVPLRKAERGKRQGAGLKPGPYKPSGRS